MATSEKRQKLFGGFNRLRDFPLDASSLYETKEDLLNYLATNKTAYAGQLVIVKNGDGAGLYRVKLDNDEVTLVVGEPLATGEDMIQAFSDIADIRENIADHEERLVSNLESINNIMDDYATKAELGNEIRKLLGDDYQNIQDELNSISELSETLNDVLVMLYDKLHEGSEYVDVVSAILTMTADIKDLSTRLDTNAQTLNAMIESDRERLTTIETWKATMTDQHILDVVNTQGLNNVEYLESFNFTKEHPSGSFTYNPGFLLTRATLTINRVTLIPNSVDSNIRVMVRVGNDTIIEEVELPVSECSDLVIGYPMLNVVPNSTGVATVMFTSNISSITGSLNLSYTVAPR